MIIDKLILQMMKDVNKLSEEKHSNRYIKKHPIEKVFLLLLLQQYSGIDNRRAFSLYIKRMIGDTTETISQSELSNDKKSLKWAVKEGFIHIFDRGYNDYRYFLY